MRMLQTRFTPRRILWLVLIAALVFPAFAGAETMLSEDTAFLAEEIGPDGAPPAPPSGALLAEGEASLSTAAVPVLDTADDTRLLLDPEGGAADDALLPWRFDTVDADTVIAPGSGLGLEPGFEPGFPATSTAVR